MRPRHHVINAGQIERRETQLVQAVHRRIAVQNAHHDLFAVDRRQGGNPQVDHAHRRFDGNPAILRPAALGDIKLRHDFQARNQRLMHLVRNMNLVDQHPVNPVAHDNTLGARLNMDVGSTEPDRLDDDCVGNADCRWRFGIAQQILEFGHIVILDDDLDPFIGIG